MEPRHQFGRNLRDSRKAAGLSQEQLSDRSGFHVTEISRLERGARDPRLATIVGLARALELRPAELLAGLS